MRVVCRSQAHPFFGRLDWEKLLTRQLPSPLKQSVEVVATARQAGGARANRHQVNTVDRELAPSYLSRQSSALVADWDYVAPQNAGAAQQQPHPLQPKVPVVPAHPLNANAAAPRS